MKPQPMSQEVPSWETENLVSRVRHDLLQPAAAMKLLLSRLDELTSQDEVRSLAKILNRSVAELDETVQRIADHMMLVHGSVESSPAPLNIRAWMNEEAPTFADRAKAAGLDFHIDVPDTTVTTDAALLSRVVGELLDNAIDFTQTGSVSLIVGTDPAFQISVCDTGIGLPTSSVQVLMKPYFTEQAEKSRRQNRLGIGLPRAELAAALLGGTVTLQPNTSGQGTMAIATLSC